MVNITLNIQHESNWLLELPIKSTIDLVDLLNNKINLNFKNIPQKTSSLNYNKILR